MPAMSPPAGADSWKVNVESNFTYPALQMEDMVARVCKLCGASHGVRVRGTLSHGNP